jgi:GNAT superfamily N-acetyltransferase
MGPDDRAYVLASWLDDFRRSRWARAVGGAYYQGHAKIAQGLIDNTSVMLCVWADTPDYILGWACTGPASTIHYCYVRRDWRGKGIAKLLLAPFVGRITQVTHLTENVRLPDEWVLNPYQVLDS